MSRINDVAKSCALARRKKDWEELEVHSRELLNLLKATPDRHDVDLRVAAKNYLSSILGEGKFLLGSDPKGLARFQNGISTLQLFLKVDSAEILKRILPEIRNIDLVRIYLSDGKSDAKNKAASSLRKLGRPDLAIELASDELLKSRLNYYSLVVRGSAFVDLGQIDLAIQDGAIALRHSTKDRRIFPLTLLARAYREKFKKDGHF